MESVVTSVVPPTAPAAVVGMWTSDVATASHALGWLTGRSLSAAGFASTGDDRQHVVLATASDADAAATVAADLRAELGPAPGSPEVDAFAVKGGASNRAAILIPDVSVLFAVRLEPSADWLEPFTEWLHTEHFARQTEMPGVEWGLGYERVIGEPAVLNLWAVGAADVVDSPQWLEMRNTEWWDRVSGAFGSGPLVRGVYRRTAP